MRRLDQLNPISTAFYYVCVIVVTMFSMNPLLLAVSLFSSVLTCAVQRATTARVHLFSLVIFLVGAVLNPIFVHNGETVLFYLNDRPFTFEAVAYGVTAAVMIVSALYWLRSLSRSLDSDKLIYIFGRFSPKLALLLSMTLRFVELFKQRWHKIQDTQRALGLYDDGNLIDAVKGRARVLSILITWTLENGIITAESMEARGYNSAHRRSFARYRFHFPDALFMALCAVLTALSIYSVYRSKVSFYPRLDFDLLGLWGILGATAFLLLCLLPVILSAKEAVKWRCLISKI